MAVCTLCCFKSTGKVLGESRAGRGEIHCTCKYLRCSHGKGDFQVKPYVVKKKEREEKKKLGWSKAKSPEWKKRGVVWLELSGASGEVVKNGAELGWSLTEEPHSPAQDLVPFLCLGSYCRVWSRETKWWATCFRKPGSFFSNIPAMPGLHSFLPFFYQQLWQPSIWFHPPEHHGFLCNWTEEMDMEELR